MNQNSQLQLTQQAVGQLQGMFKRLAAKMETDVATIRQALETLAGHANMAQQNIKHLHAEVNSLKAEIAALRIAKGRIKLTPEVPVQQPAKPATVDGREVKAEILPPIMTESATDDAFFAGEDD